MCRNIIAYVIVLLSFVPTFAEPPAAPKPVAQDGQELVFLQSARPYRLRLHLQIHGESFQTQWARIVEALFQYLDVDGNGVLSAAEMEHAPSPEQLRGLVQGSTELEAAPPPQMAEVTDNPKAGVTLEQLKSYYRRAGIAPWQAEWATRAGRPPDHLDAAILKQWELNETDKWPKDVLKNAVKNLFELDRDGDELITVQELAPNSGLAGFQMQLLPQAKALADNAKKIVAEHNAAPAFNRQ